MDYEKEEAWLNEMSAKGFAFIGVSPFGRFAFVESAPGEYIYRINYLKNDSNHPESQQYLSFMAETGAECVFSKKKRAYFRKKAENGNFDIYSDVDSRIAHYRLAGSFFLPLGILEMCGGTLQLLIILTEELSFLNLFTFGCLWIMCAIFLHFWNRLRKKIKNLEKEKGVWV